MAIESGQLICWTHVHDWSWPIDDRDRGVGRDVLTATPDDAPDRALMKGARSAAGVFRSCIVLTAGARSARPSLSCPCPSKTVPRIASRRAGQSSRGSALARSVGFKSSNSGAAARPVWPGHRRSDHQIELGPARQASIGPGGSGQDQCGAAGHIRGRAPDLQLALSSYGIKSLRASNIKEPNRDDGFVQDHPFLLLARRSLATRDRCVKSPMSSARPSPANRCRPFRAPTRG
jgi:hypothetical protein